MDQNTDGVEPGDIRQTSKCASAAFPNVPLRLQGGGVDPAAST
jgi:hypothetical protein